MITKTDIDKVLNYTRADTEDSKDIETFIEASGIYIDSMVGENYKVDEKAVKLAELLQLKIINDMYENRGSNASNLVRKDIISSSILNKLSNY